MTKNDELERARFEGNWLSRGGEATDLERYPVGHVEPGSGDVGGTYVCDIVQGHWQTWCASRSAIEIKLPPTVITAEIGPAISLEKLTSRLAVNGIKVKS